MNSKNTEEELIIGIKEKDFNKFKEFLKSLDLRDGNQDLLEHWFYESAWLVESEDGEKFTVIFGKKMIHLFLKKNNKFKQLEKKFFQFIDF